MQAKPVALRLLWVAALLLSSLLSLRSVSADSDSKPPPVAFVVYTDPQETKGDLHEQAVALRNQIRSDKRLICLLYNPDLSTFIMAARSADPPIDLSNSLLPSERVTVAYNTGAAFFAVIGHVGHSHDIVIHLFPITTPDVSWDWKGHDVKDAVDPLTEQLLTPPGTPPAASPTTPTAPVSPAQPTPPVAPITPPPAVKPPVTSQPATPTPITPTTPAAPSTPVTPATPTTQPTSTQPPATVTPTVPKPNAPSPTATPATETPATPPTPSTPAPVTPVAPTVTTSPKPIPVVPTPVQPVAPTPAPPTVVAPTPSSPVVVYHRPTVTPTPVAPPVATPPVTKPDTPTPATTSPATPAPSANTPPTTVPTATVPTAMVPDKLPAATTPAVQPTAPATDTPGAVTPSVANPPVVTLPSVTPPTAVAPTTPDAPPTVTVPADPVPGSGSTPDAAPAGAHDRTSLSDRAHTLVAQGDTAVETSDLFAAIDDYRQAINVSPLNTGVRLKLAQVYVQAGQVPRAIDEARRALMLDPNAKAVGDFLQGLSDKGLIPPGDITVQLAAVSREPENSDAWLALGDAYWNAGNPDKACDSYTKAASISPDAPAPQSRLARYYAATSQYDKALDSLAKAGPLGYPNALRIIASRTDNLFSMMHDARDAFDKGTTPREKYYKDMQAIDRQAQSLAAFVAKVSPPTEFKVSYLHRNLATKLLAQTSASWVAYIETGDDNDKDQAADLESSADAEMKTASIAEKLQTDAEASTTGK